MAIKMAKKWQKNGDENGEKILKDCDKMVIKMATKWRNKDEKMATKWR